LFRGEIWVRLAYGEQNKKKKREEKRKNPWSEVEGDLVSLGEKWG